MVPTIKCNLVAGNSCLTKLTEQLFVQQITIGGHIGSIVKAILFLQILHNVGHFQHSVFAKSRFTSKPCKYDLFIARRLCSYILLNSVQCVSSHTDRMVIFIAIWAAEIAAFRRHQCYHEDIIQQRSHLVQRMVQFFLGYQKLLLMQIACQRRIQFRTAAATGEIDELLLQAMIGQPDGIAIQF